MRWARTEDGIVQAKSKITIVIGQRVHRTRALHVGRSWLVVNVGPMMLRKRDEGQVWARGWYTKAADALRAAVMLARSAQ